MSSPIQPLWLMLETPQITKQIHVCTVIVGAVIVVAYASGVAACCCAVVVIVTNLCLQSSSFCRMFAPLFFVFMYHM